MPKPLTAIEAAKALGVSRTRVLALIRAGRLPASKAGSQYLIRQGDLYRVRTRKPGRPKAAVSDKEAKAREKRIEARQPMTDFDVVQSVRKAIWRTWLASPENLRWLVVQKFHEFTEELEATGDLG